MEGHQVSLLSLPTELHIQIFNAYNLTSKTVSEVRRSSASHPHIASYSTLCSLALTHHSLLTSARIVLYAHPCFLRSDSQRKLLDTMKDNIELRLLVKSLDIWECSRKGWKEYMQESIELLCLCSHLKSVWFEGLERERATTYLFPIFSPPLDHTVTHLTIRSNDFPFSYISLRLHQFRTLKHLALWDIHCKEKDVQWPTGSDKDYGHSLSVLEFHNCDLPSQAICRLFDSKRGIKELKILYNSRSMEGWIKDFQYLKNNQNENKDILQKLVVSDTFKIYLDFDIHFLQWMDIVTLADPTITVKVSMEDDRALLLSSGMVGRMHKMLDSLHLKQLKGIKAREVYVEMVGRYSKSVLMQESHVQIQSF